MSKETSCLLPRSAPGILHLSYKDLGRDVVNSSVMVAPADSCFTSYTVCDHRSCVFRVTKQCIVLLEMPPPSRREKSVL